MPDLDIRISSLKSGAAIVPSHRFPNRAVPDQISKKQIQANALEAIKLHPPLSENHHIRLDVAPTLSHLPWEYHFESAPRLPITREFEFSDDVFIPSGNPIVLIVYSPEENELGPAYQQLIQGLPNSRGTGVEFIPLATSEKKGLSLSEEVRQFIRDDEIADPNQIIGVHILAHGAPPGPIMNSGIEFCWSHAPPGSPGSDRLKTHHDGRYYMVSPQAISALFAPLKNLLFLNFQVCHSADHPVPENNFCRYLSDQRSCPSIVGFIGKPSAMDSSHFFLKYYRSLFQDARSFEQAFDAAMQEFPRSLGGMNNPFLPVCYLAEPVRSLNSIFDRSADGKLLKDPFGEPLEDDVKKAFLAIKETSKRSEVVVSAATYLRDLDGGKEALACLISTDLENVARQEIIHAHKDYEKVTFVTRNTYVQEDMPGSYPWNRWIYETAGVERYLNKTSVPRNAGKPIPFKTHKETRTRMPPQKGTNAVGHILNSWLGVPSPARFQTEGSDSNLLVLLRPKFDHRTASVIDDIFDFLASKAASSSTIPIHIDLNSKDWRELTEKRGLAPAERIGKYLGRMPDGALFSNCLELLSRGGQWSFVLICKNLEQTTTGSLMAIEGFLNKFKSAKAIAMASIPLEHESNGSVDEYIFELTSQCRRQTPDFLELVKELPLDKRIDLVFDRLPASGAEATLELNDAATAQRFMDGFTSGNPEEDIRQKKITNDIGFLIQRLVDNYPEDQQRGIRNFIVECCQYDDEKMAGNSALHWNAINIVKRDQSFADGVVGRLEKEKWGSDEDGRNLIFLIWALGDMMAPRSEQESSSVEEPNARDIHASRKKSAISVLEKIIRLSGSPFCIWNAGFALAKIQDFKNHHDVGIRIASRRLLKKFLGSILESDCFKNLDSGIVRSLYLKLWPAILWQAFCSEESSEGDGGKDLMEFKERVSRNAVEDMLMHCAATGGWQSQLNDNSIVELEGMQWSEAKLDEKGDRIKEAQYNAIWLLGEWSWNEDQRSGVISLLEKVLGEPDQKIAISNAAAEALERLKLAGNGHLAAVYNAALAERTSRPLMKLRHAREKLFNEAVDLTLGEIFDSKDWKGGTPVRPYSDLVTLGDESDEGLLLIKPPGSLRRSTIRKILRRVHEFGFFVRKFKVLKGRQVRSRKIFKEAFWAPISAGNLLNEEERDEVADIYGETALNWKIFTSDQLLEESPIGKLGITRIWEAGRRADIFQTRSPIGINKIGAHKSVIAARIGNYNGGEPFLLVNGFLPKLQKLFEKRKHRTIAFWIEGNGSWKMLRTECVGDSNNPLKCLAASIRRDALYGRIPLAPFTAVNGQKNVVHLSRGPLEAMWDLHVWFDVPLAECRFGRKSGLDAESLVAYCHDASLKKDTELRSINDALKELDLPK